MRSTRSLCLNCASAALLFLGCVSLQAQACSITASGIAFPPINPIANSAVDSVGTLLIDCPENTPYTVSLGIGEGSYQQRVMRSGNDSLLYNVFLDVNRLQIWGDGSGSTLRLSATAGATPASHAVYARVPAQPLARIGTYGDAFLVVVEF